MLSSLSPNDIDNNLAGPFSSLKTIQENYSLEIVYNMDEQALIVSGNQKIKNLKAKFQAASSNTSILDYLLSETKELKSEINDLFSRLNVNFLFSTILFYFIFNLQCIISIPFIVKTYILSVKRLKAKKLL